MDSVNAYIYTGGTTPAKRVNLSAGTITYLSADRIGSVRGTVSSAGALTASTNYGAWGNPESAGGYVDSDQLIYLLNRHYDPAAAAAH
jgi:hypothetical protein